ncbi:MAG: D-amino acid dehydrogenase [Rhodospirillales bacterium]|nr:D-amino acid dehydrogenase [Rhodospirillales bacterium]MDH3914338.1 D-amino acid dehydrogenase [Rhodospirillales bacterium]MDH3918961.1 D-amino acid dehydrogenase [Rhodospirillales bacterium]MDH3965486.1 D-amino acid dehydrogenase [Rhodospirillales bacterium]
MKVMVMGAGVIGVTTAYCLLKDGHEVTVLERNAGAAEETSATNAGLIAPGHAYAWASPKAPAMLLKSLWRDDQALRFKPRLDPRLWRWSLSFLRQCTAARARANTLRKHRLCLYAQAAFNEMVAETGVAYDGENRGLLYLYRNARDFDQSVAKTAILSGGGQDLRAVDRDEIARIDPALAPVKDKLAGAIYCPTDASGDARLFTQGLAEACTGMGGRFLYGTAIRGIETEGDQVVRVATDRGEERAEVYVMALGCESPLLARRLGVRLPIYPVKGYSVTLPVEAGHSPPAIGGVDEGNLVAYARMGKRLRVTATAEFAGYDLAHKPADFRHMLAAARDLFPAGGQWDRPDYRACLRPMTPEGSPIFGLGAQRNLYYNVGHGHMGWTMACGAARITADLVAGRDTEIPIEGMTLR